MCGLLQILSLEEESGVSIPAMDVRSYLHTSLQQVPRELPLCVCYCRDCTHDHNSMSQYRDPSRTFRDVDTALQMYGSLKPKMDTYSKQLNILSTSNVPVLTLVIAYDHGDTQLLLCLYGTTPITYRSSPYNIPVAIWIPNDYPLSPPIFYVKPTSNMLVRPGINVDVSGFCYHSYLATWKDDVMVGLTKSQELGKFSQVLGTHSICVA